MSHHICIGIHCTIINTVIILYCHTINAFHMSYICDDHQLRVSTFKGVSLPLNLCYLIKHLGPKIITTIINTILSFFCPFKHQCAILLFFQIWPTITNYVIYILIIIIWIITNIYFHLSQPYIWSRAKDVYLLFFLRYDTIPILTKRYRYDTIPNH